MWSMGHVKERYLQYEKAGDQYLGRVVSGLDVNSVKFAVSPPYFEFDETTNAAGSGIDEAADDGTWKKIYTLLRDYMVRGEFVSASVHRIFYFCFASLCFHADFLKRVLHDRSKLRASHFFTHIPLDIQSAATVKYPWTSTQATPTLTGLPPHITILANFERMIAEMETTKNAILAGVEAELDRRRIGSQSHFDKQEILDAMMTMHTEVLKKVDLCVRSSTTALQQIELAPPFDGATGDVPSFFVNDADESVGQPLNIIENVSRRKFQYFYSAGGSIRRLPHNFVFPAMGLCALIVNWFCGNPRENTMPLKFIIAADLKSKGMKCEYRKMKVMMGAVIAGAQELGVWDAGYRGAWDVPRAMRLYGQVQHLFNYPSLTSTTRRSDQISWRTVYNLYIKGRRGHGGRQGLGRGRGHGRQAEIAENDENYDWMNQTEEEAE
jgi:hypothetical protein